MRMCLEAGAARVLVLDYAFRSGRDSSLVTSGILSACDGVREGLCHNLTHDLHYREITLEGARGMHTNAIMRDVLDANVLIAARLPGPILPQV